MNFHKLIKEICQEEGIFCESISYNWGLVLQKEGVIKCILGYHFPLNDQAIGRIIDDKFALYDLCSHLNIPIIEHHILWNPKSSYSAFNIDLKKYFHKYDNNVVLKPNNGTLGNDVYHLTREEDLKKICPLLFKKNYSISICPFYDISNEYRVIVLDGIVKLSFEKVRPLVVGDGIHSIKELLIKQNPSYFSKINFSSKENKILKENECYFYDWRFNLNKGAMAREISDKNTKKRVEKFAKEVAKKLAIRFASFDIIIFHNNLYLMEINAGVCINLVTNFLDNGKNLAKNIYREAILKMFDS